MGLPQFGDFHNFHSNLINILQVFRQNGGGLKFTIEVPVDSGLQLLDIQLTFKENHTYRQYRSITKKPLLSFRSSHSKVIKNSVMFSCLRGAICKSCHRAMGESILIKLASPQRGQLFKVRHY